VPEPLEARDEFLIEHRDFTVEGDGLGLERGQGVNNVAEPLGVVSSVPANEPHVAGFLQGNHAPTVVLLLVDPALGVKLASYLGRVHEGGERSLWQERLREQAALRPCKGTRLNDPHSDDDMFLSVYRPSE
jgi:hypothetical protein